MTALPTWVHELVVAPAAFGLAWHHARRALGAARATLELVALAAYGFALERVAMLVFTSHVYGPTWRLAPLGVPVAVAVVWAAVITSAMAVAARLGLQTPVARGLGAALVGVALDLLMEPVAVRAGLWRWTPPGPWLGVPIGNFVGWGVIVAAYAAGAERWSAGDGVVAPLVRRLTLAAASIAALLAVGFAWTRAGAERLFAGAGGWAAWAAALTAAALLGAARRHVVAGDTLAGRLAASPGQAPPLVFLVVASAFSVDAVGLGGPALLVVAAGSLVALGTLAQRAGGWRS